MFKLGGLFFLVAFYLQGCAVIPGTESTVVDVSNTEPIIYESSKTIFRVSNCIVKNVDENIGSFAPTLIFDMAGDSAKIRIRSDAGVAALIDIKDSGDGSNVTVRISNHYLMKMSLAKIMVKECL